MPADTTRWRAPSDWNAVGELFIDYWAGPGTWAAMPDERKQNTIAMLPPVVHEWSMATTGLRPLEGWRAITAPVHLIHAADTRAPTRAITQLLANDLSRLARCMRFRRAATWRRCRAPTWSIR